MIGEIKRKIWTLSMAILICLGSILGLLAHVNAQEISPLDSVKKIKDNPGFLSVEVTKDENGKAIISDTGVAFTLKYNADKKPQEPQKIRLTLSKGMKLVYEEGSVQNEDKTDTVVPFSKTAGIKEIKTVRSPGEIMGFIIDKNAVENIYEITLDKTEAEETLIFRTEYLEDTFINHYVYVNGSYQAEEYKALAEVVVPSREKYQPKANIQWGPGSNAQPVSFDLTLLNGSGVAVQTATITEKDSEWIFEPVPKFDENNQVIPYTLGQSEVEDLAITANNMDVFVNIPAPVNEATAEPPALDTDKPPLEPQLMSLDEEPIAAPTDGSLRASFAPMAAAVRAPGDTINTWLYVYKAFGPDTPDPNNFKVRITGPNNYLSEKAFNGAEAGTFLSGTGVIAGDYTIALVPTTTSSTFNVDEYDITYVYSLTYPTTPINSGAATGGSVVLPVGNNNYLLTFTLTKKATPSPVDFKIKTVDSVTGLGVAGATVTLTDDQNAQKTGTTSESGELILNGYFTANTVYNATISSPEAYDNKTESITYTNPTTITNVALVKKPVVIPLQKLPVQVKGSDGTVLYPVRLTLQDDKGVGHSLLTTTDGKVTFEGDFTPNRAYPVTVSNVPTGYTQPTQPISITYIPSTGDANIGDLQNITLQKITAATGDLTVTTNVNPGNVALEFYRGTYATGTPVVTAIVQNGGPLIVNGNFESFEHYVVKIASVSGTTKTYETGGSSTFTYNPQNANLNVSLVEREILPEGTIKVRIREGSETGPLSTVLDGSLMGIKWVFSTFSGYTSTAPITNGTVAFTVANLNTYYKVGALSVPEGYILSNPGNIWLPSGSGKYVDLVLKKNSGTVYLQVTPPDGYQLTPNMTASVVNAAGQVVAGPQSIASGSTVFNDVPVGNGYKIQYGNLPAGFTSNNALTSNFNVLGPGDQVVVKDKLGFIVTPNTSLIDVYVEDNLGNKMPGFEFTIYKKTATGPVRVTSLTTGINGSAQISMAKLANGEYYAENTTVPTGYLKIANQDFTITDQQYNASITGVTGKTNEVGNLYIKLQDSSGAAVPGAQVVLYNSAGTQIGTMVTDAEGKTYAAPINIGTYTVKYFAPEDGGFTDVSDTITVAGGQNANLTLVTAPKTNHGQLMAKTVVKGTGVPAPNVDVDVVDSNNLLVQTLKTDATGHAVSKYLPIGNYKVVPRYSSVYKASVPTEAILEVKTGEITEQQFVLEKNFIEVGNAGSIVIEGQVSGDVSNLSSAWTITVNKSATASGDAIRAPINTIYFKADELTTPQDLKLTVNGIEKPINGHFSKELLVDAQGNPLKDSAGNPIVGADGNPVMGYILRDDQSANKTSGEDVYIYTFNADPLSSATNFTVHAEVDIKSSVDLELIAPKIATKTLNPDDKIAATLSISGSGRADFVTDETVWSFTSEANTNAPVKGQFTLTLPSTSGQFPFSEDNLVNGTRLYIKNAAGGYDLLPTSAYTKEIADGKLIIKTDFPIGSSSYKVETTTKINHDINVDPYKLDVEISVSDLTNNPKLIARESTTATAPQGPYPTGSQTTQNSSCPNGKHRVVLKGQMNADGKSIHWVARVTNLNLGNAFGKYPIKLDIAPGGGLGAPTNINYFSVGQSFPYIYNQTGNNVGIRTDNAGPVNQGLTVDNVVASYPYTVGPIYGLFNNLKGWYKKDLVQNLTHNYGGDAQRLAPGEYLNVEYDTPITDYSQFDTGYTMDVQSTAADTASGYTYNWNNIQCQMNTQLTIKREPYQASIKGCNFELPGLGGFTARGKYINSGNDIEWTINSYPLQKNANDIGARRDVKVNFAIADADGNLLTDTATSGLGVFKDASLSYTTIGSGNAASHTGEGGYSGSFQTYMETEDYSTFKIVSPVDRNNHKSSYQLKVSGTVYDYWTTNASIPVAGTTDVFDCMVTIQGQWTDISVRKKWENVSIGAGDTLPPIQLQLVQNDIAGNATVIRTETVSTPMGKDNVFHLFMDLPLYDDIGNPLSYSIKEVGISGYHSDVFKLSTNSSAWSALNTKIDAVSQNVEDPTKYTTDQTGKYPTDFRQDGPDIRNADTLLDETQLDPVTKKPIGGDAGSPYKVAYEDALIGKSGAQTGTPGEFNMKLTIEGKSKTATHGMDIVLVLDNSRSMDKPYSTTPEKKIETLNRTVSTFIDQVARDYPEARIGIVNFATRIDPIGEKDCYGAYYTTQPVVGLTQVNNTTNITNLKKGIPTKIRINIANFEYQNFQQINYGTRYDGLTNIQLGMRRGIQELYADGTGSSRSKHVILVSDGAPSASMKINAYPFDQNKTAEENTAYTPWDPPGLYATNFYQFLPVGTNTLNYTVPSPDGSTTTLVDNHILPTIAEVDYWKEKHQDMNIYSIGIAADVQVDVSPVEVMKTVLTNITTDKTKNFYAAEKAGDLERALTDISTGIKEESIVNGTVTDPMGSMVKIKDVNGDGVFTPASSASLTDGDYYLSDNRGYHMTQYGPTSPNNANNLVVQEMRNKQQVNGIYGYYQILNQSPVALELDSRGYVQYYWLNGVRTINRDAEGYLKYIFATRDGAGGYWNANSWSPNVTLLENVWLSNSTRRVKVLWSDVAANANQVSESLLNGVTAKLQSDTIVLEGLNLGFSEEVTIQYRINLKTEDNAFIGENYYQANKTTTLQPNVEMPNILRNFPIPSVKGPIMPIEIVKKWQDYNGSAIPPPADISVKFNLVRQEEGSTNTEVVRTFSLNNTHYDADRGEMVYRLEGLPAYSDTGKIFTYLIEEFPIEGYEYSFTDSKLKPVYNMVTGTSFEKYDPTTGNWVSAAAEDKYLLTATNRQNTTPLFDFTLEKQDAADKTKLEGAKFKLFEEDGVTVAVPEAASNSQGRIEFNNLPAGIYKLKETKSPTGYILNPKIYEINIDGSGLVSLLNGDNKVTYDANNLLLIFENKKAVYPITGGIGSMVFVGIGLGLAAWAKRKKGGMLKEE